MELNPTVEFAIIFLVLRIILIIILYIFIGWVVYTIWKDIKIKEKSNKPDDSNEHPKDN